MEIMTSWLIGIVVIVTLAIITVLALNDKDKDIIDRDDDDFIKFL